MPDLTPTPQIESDSAASASIIPSSVATHTALKPWQISAPTNNPGSPFSTNASYPTDQESKDNFKLVHTDFLTESPDARMRDEPTESTDEDLHEREKSPSEVQMEKKGVSTESIMLSDSPRTQMSRESHLKRKRDLDDESDCTASGDDSSSAEPVRKKAKKSRANKRVKGEKTKKTKNE